MAAWVAVITAEPTPTIVTKPVEASTVATPVLPLLKVIAPAELLVGVCVKAASPSVLFSVANANEIVGAVVTVPVTCNSFVVNAPVNDELPSAERLTLVVASA